MRLRARRSSFPHHFRPEWREFTQAPASYPGLAPQPASPAQGSPDEILAARYPSPCVGGIGEKRQRQSCPFSLISVLMKAKAFIRTLCLAAETLRVSPPQNEGLPSFAPLRDQHSASRCWAGPPLMTRGPGLMTGQVFCRAGSDSIPAGSARCPQTAPPSDRPLFQRSRR